ncbi:TIGR02677 family protein [Listeria seeligeri]|uniref:TIGR02677 family protein n=1 Tax=Listeria seeligeri TaxID=1640 RepID=UPI001887665D|nr:TIGR02677 family protein [Listeria seeligeri]MBF2663973.1 TIGR02677 family protein [Listeria seeligeri]
MTEQIYSKLNEASYLTAENYQRYRLIMKYFYEQHRSMNDLLYRKDILKYIQEEVGYTNYQEKELDQDLNSLISWGNLETRQEISKPKSIEEYKNRHFRYQISEASVAIEEMLENITNLASGARGSLDKHTFERLLTCLRDLQKRELDGQELLNIWEDILGHFDKIRKNTADYIGYLNSEKSELQMQAEAFLVYRDKFVNYLRDFIIAMQDKIYQIQNCFENMLSEQLEKIFQQVLKKEKEIPRLAEMELDEENLKKDFLNKWNNMTNWFIDRPHKQSEYSLLLKQTNHAIDKITHTMQRFGDQMQQYRSRKKDYLHLAKWFSECDTIEKAHKLSAFLFGFEQTRHYYAFPFSSGNKYAEIWETDPSIHDIQSRDTNNQRKKKNNSFIRNSEEKYIARKTYLKENELLEKKIVSYIKNNKIDLQDIDFIEQDMRRLLLKWLSLSLQREDRTVYTEFNMNLQLEIFQNDTVVLHSEDGKLMMPRVIYSIIKKGGE